MQEKGLEPFPTRLPAPSRRAPELLNSDEQRAALCLPYRGQQPPCHGNRSLGKEPPACLPPPDKVTFCSRSRPDLQAGWHLAGEEENGSGGAGCWGGRDAGGRAGEGCRHGTTRNPRLP